MLRAWFLLSALLVTNVRADDPLLPAKATGPYVVIVGVGEYQDKAIQPRPTAETDARAFYDTFADQKFCAAGKECAPGEERVILLTATEDAKRKSRKATRENVSKAIHDAIQKTNKNDVVVVAFFGRGASLGDKTCLFSTDTQFKERAKTGILGADLEADLKAARDRKLCLLFDVDFKGYDTGGEKLAEPNLRDILSAIYGGEEQGDQVAPPDKFVALSSVPGNIPPADGDSGLFAKVVLEALRGAADVDGYEPDGLVTVDELVKYLEKEIPDRSRKLGKTREEKEAHPFFVGEAMSHFPIALNPVVTPTTEKRLKALESGTLTAAQVAEGKALLTRMPKLKAPQEMRKRYQDYCDGSLTAEAFTSRLNKIKDSMKLPPEDAIRYGRVMTKAINLLQQNYVKELSHGEWAVHAVKGLYRRLEEPVPEDLVEQLKKLKVHDEEKIRSLLAKVRTSLGVREDLEGNKDLDMTIQMMLSELRDPYTTYYDKETIKKMDAPLRGEFRGVGIQIRRDLVRDGLLVVSPIKDSPAYKAGIRAGDLITTIKRESDPQGQPLAPEAPKVISTKGMKTEKALEVMLGKVGVPITLVIERDGEAKPLEYTIKRDKVTVETVLGIKRDENDDWNWFVDAENKIGYVQLTQFAPNTGRDLNNAIKAMRQEGLKGLVVDLRFNPGGLLAQAVAVSSLFVEEGTVVSVKARNREGQAHQTLGGTCYKDFPVTVIVNGESASASEIVAACLQDYNRATIIGERSYGKGSVQNVEDFHPSSGQIKMTIARYFPPLGRNIDKHSTGGKPEDEWGVKPDKGFEVPLERDEHHELAEHFRDRETIKAKGVETKEDKKKNFKDRQLQKAVEHLREQINAKGEKGEKSDK